MITVITGGSGSGKSEFAEELAVASGSAALFYIATMESYGEENRKKIERHRQMRQGKNFKTIECPVGLKNVWIEKGSTVLLECMSNLAANEMFSKEGAGKAAFLAVREGITHLISRAEHLIVVTNNVFEDGIEYSGETREYMQVLGVINQWLGSVADQVFEVVYGIPVKIGEEK